MNMYVDQGVCIYNSLFTPLPHWHGQTAKLNKYSYSYSPYMDIHTRARASAYASKEYERQYVVTKRAGNTKRTSRTSNWTRFVTLVIKCSGRWQNVPQQRGRGGKKESRKGKQFLLTWWIIFTGIADIHNFEHNFLIGLHFGATAHNWSGLVTVVLVWIADEKNLWMPVQILVKTGKAFHQPKSFHL